MRRRAALVAVWLLGTTASVALAWTAVSAVGGHVTKRPAGELTMAEVADAAGAPTTSPTTPQATGSATAPTSSTASTRRPATTSPVPATSTTTSTATTAAPSPPPASAPPSTAPSSTGTFQSQGGAVGVTCSGSQASLEFASPAGGYATEIHDAGPERVDVRFESDELDRESRIVVRCSGGAPSAEVEEDDDG